MEFIRPMDSMTSSIEGDWAEIKELEKNERYTHLLHQLSLRPSRSTLELYKSQLHSWSTGLPQEDSIPRQALPSRSYEL